MQQVGGMGGEGGGDPDRSARNLTLTRRSTCSCSRVLVHEGRCPFSIKMTVSLRFNEVLVASLTLTILDSFTVLD